MKRGFVIILGLGLLALAPLAGYDARAGGLPAWITPAMAAEDVTFENLSFSLGPLNFTIPKIMTTGSSLSRSDLQSLVSGAWSAATVDTLAKLDATSITIPEIHWELTQTMPATAGKDAATMTQNGAQRDVRLDDIKGGKVARVSIGGISNDVKGPVSVSYMTGPLQSTDYDLAGAVRVFFATAQPGEAPKQLAGPTTIDGIQLKAPEGVEVKVGKVAYGAIKMRPLSTPVASLFPMMMAANASGKPMHGPDAAKVLAMVADLYDAFAIDGISISDIAVKVPNPAFQGAQVKTVKVGAIANSRFAELGLEGLDVNAAGGHVKLGRLALLGLDLKTFLSALADVAKTGDIDDKAMQHLDWRTAIPHLDSIVVKGVDVAAPMGPGAPKSFTLAGYELKLGNYVGAIPTKIRSQLDDLTGDVSLLQDKAAQLQALGYKTVDLSTVTDLIWDEPKKSISVNELSAKGADMGAMTIKGTLGNAPRELFSGSVPQMRVAGLGVTLADASLRLENTGLLDRIAEMLANMQNTTADNLRTKWGTQAALAIPAVLGNSDKAKGLGNAIAAFIAKPKSLAISIKARDANGLGITDVVDVMSARGADPKALFEKLDVTATANQ
jgi:hypothetical protein